MPLVKRPPAELDAEYAASGFKAKVVDLIATNRFTSVCDLGGGSRPLLTLEEVAELGLDYTILDISQEQLDRAPEAYGKVRADICEAVTTLGPSERFDLMFSKMVAEHVRDGEAMHRNVFALLRPGGIAFHFFPTLFSPVFVVNRVLPERLARPLCHTAFSKEKEKFPARYSKCYGPTASMRRLFERIGYEILEHRPFYRSGYFARVPVLRELDDLLGAWAARRNSPWLCSYAYLVLRKPAAR